MEDGEWHEGFELTPIGANHQKFKWIKDKMSRTIVEHNGKKIGGYEIVEVYHIKNSNLWEKYTTRRKEIWHDTKSRVKELRLFHGTNRAEEIAENGFKVELSKTNGMFGKGIYFADLSSKSNQYTFEGCNSECSEHELIFCTTCVRSMLVCRVAMGEQYFAEHPMHGITEPPDDFHCVIGQPGVTPNLKYKEFAVYDNYQAYPGHLVKYRIKI